MNAAHGVRLRLSHRFALPAAIAVLLLGTTPAFGQDDEPEAEPKKSVGVEDLFVTAERREARLQDTPVAVSVFTGADLDNQGYLDFEDVSVQIPNVQFGRSLVGSGGVTIRGISSSSGDRSTAFHFDGIYVNRSTAVEGLTFFDIQRVEVLRGPQGTLYGRNATGGSINVISNPPGPDLEAFGDFQFGSYNQTLWRAALNLPIISEELFARVSLFGEQRDGFQKNITQKQTVDWDGSPKSRKDADDASEFALRSQLRWLPTDSLDLTFRYNYSQRTGVGAAQKILGDFADSVRFETGPPVDIFLILDQYCRSDGARVFGCQVTDNPTDNRQIALDLIGDVDAWDHNWNGQLVWDLPELAGLGETQLKTHFSYYRSKSYGQSDQDGSDGDLVRVYATNKAIPASDFQLAEGCQAEAFGQGATEREAGCKPGYNKLSETTFELTWKNSGDTDLDWLVGAFYLYSRGNGSAIATTKPAPWVTDSSLGPLGPLASFLQVPVLTDSKTRAKSAAIFGETTYHFGRDTDTTWDDWHATFGLRYTYDWKKRVSQTPQVILDVPGFGLFPVQAPIDESDSDDWTSFEDAVTGTARLKWDWSSENHVSLTASRGYKAGFINNGLQDPLDSSSEFDNADPEHIWALELGSKNRFWEDRIQANLTGFYYWYDDLQVSQLQGATVLTQNAADADVWGFEAELVGKPLEGFVPEFLEGLTLVGNFGYLHAEYDSFDNCYLGEATIPGATTPAQMQNNSRDCSGNTLVRAPEYTILLTAAWPLDFGRYGTLTPNAQFRASGKVYFRPTNCPNSDCEDALSDPFFGGRQQNDDFQSSYEIWDARINWTSEDRLLSASAFVDNIADKDIIQSQVVGSHLIGAPIQVRFDRPRTWGFRFGLAW